MSIQYGASGTTALFEKAAKIKGLQVAESGIYYFTL